MREVMRAMATHPVTISLLVAGLFCIRFLECLPFSGSTRPFNYETVATLASVLLYIGEPISFPLGVIQRLAFPFWDANIGNVGAIPLFALIAKMATKVHPYFLGFDYFVLVEILSCFVASLFAQLVLGLLGVRSAVYRAFCALLVGLSFIFLTRSAASQPFCVVEFPLFTGWLYVMLRLLCDHRVSWWMLIGAAAIFPVAALVDSYALFGMLLGTGAIVLREGYEALFGNGRNSRRRLVLVSFVGLVGISLSLAGLYLIGMYPLPPVPRTFTSYDFGIGGRYHGADVFGLVIPIAEDRSFFSVASLPAILGWPLTTSILGPGQYEGVAFVGTPVLLLWLGLAARWLYDRHHRLTDPAAKLKVPGRVLNLYSPWQKVGVGAIFVYLFSLGYELHIFGIGFPDFAVMPAAWIADRMPSAYNIRATGRLASLATLYFSIEAIRRLHQWSVSLDRSGVARQAQRPVWALWAMCVLAAVHVIEISPFLKPIQAQPLYPFGGVFDERQVQAIRRSAERHDVLLVAPSVRAVDVQWTSQAFSLAYHSGLRSNLYYLARSQPEHELGIARDLGRVMDGNWEELTSDYGNVLIAVPESVSAKFRKNLQDRFRETVIGPVSLWSRK